MIIANCLGKINYKGDGHGADCKCESCKMWKEFESRPYTSMEKLRVANIKSLFDQWNILVAKIALESGREVPSHTKEHLNKIMPPEQS